MKKRLSIFLIGTAVSVVALVGAFAGLAAAQSSADDNDSQTFVERVAAILGIESDDLEDAMQQVKEEIHSERRDAKFAELVENGTLTQEESDAIEEWQDSKPEIEFTSGDRDGEGKRGWGRKGFGHHGGAIWLGSSEKVDYLVEQGIITQTDADSLSVWWDSRPEALDDLVGDHDIKWGKKGRGKRGWKCDKDGDKDEDGTETSGDIDA